MVKKVGEDDSTNLREQLAYLTEYLFLTIRFV